MCTLLAVYRSPSGLVGGFLGDLAGCLSSLPAHSFVVGDINIDLNAENEFENISLEYCDILSKFGFFNVIESPTRLGTTKHSLIDHILVNNARWHYKSCTIDFDISDHLPVCASLALNKTTESGTEIFQMSKINYSKLRDNLQSTDWDEVLNATNVSSAFEKFIENFQQQIKISSDTKNVKRNKRKASTFKQPWMTTDLYKLTEKRRKLHQLSQTQPFNEELKTKYRNFRNFVSIQILNAKTDHLKKQFESCKSNQIQKWNFIKKILNKNKSDEHKITLKNENVLISNQKAVATQFNNFFTNVGSDLANQLPPPLTNYTQYLDSSEIQPIFTFYEIDAHDIVPIIKQMDTKKAIGHDNIPARAIKENILVIAPILVFLINFIIRSSCFPDCLKVARVKPVFKKGDKFSKNNYRPISILSAISKIVGKVLSLQIYNFLDDFDILTSKQFGFRKGKNTTLNINELMEQLYKNFDSKLATQGIFIDFSKAFDTINHEIIVHKLSFNGFKSCASQLVKSYLSNRKQFVQIGGEVSSMQNISIGVPQGSILGPLLFLIYINDLLKAAPSLNYILYADDTNIFSSDPTLLKQEISKVESWCVSNRLILNYTKTFQIVFKSPKKQIDLSNFQINMSSQILEIKNETKFLGVILDENITFKQHIKELCRKLNLILIMMRAIRPYFDQKTMIDLYYSFFYPHMLYGIEFWGHASDTDLKRVLTIQKATVRVILNKKPREHVTSFFKILKIMPVKMLFKFCTLKLLLKTFSNEFLMSLKPKHSYNTRNDDLAVQKANNKRGERSLLCSGVSLYNRYLKGVRIGAGTGFPRDLASCLWEQG